MFTFLFIQFCPIKCPYSTDYTAADGGMWWEAVPAFETRTDGNQKTLQSE